MYKQNKNILMNVLAASEPNKPRNFLWSADVNINASLHLVIIFKSMLGTDPTTILRSKLDRFINVSNWFLNYIKE